MEVACSTACSKKGSASAGRSESTYPEPKAEAIRGDQIGMFDVLERLNARSRMGMAL